MFSQQNVLKERNLVTEPLFGESAIKTHYGKILKILSILKQPLFTVVVS